MKWYYCKECDKLLLFTLKHKRDEKGKVYCKKCWKKFLYKDLKKEIEYIKKANSFIR